MIYSLHKKIAAAKAANGRVDIENPQGTQVGDGHITSLSKTAACRPNSPYFFSLSSPAKGLRVAGEVANTSTSVELGANSCGTSAPSFRG